MRRVFLLLFLFLLAAAVACQRSPTPSPTPAISGPTATPASAPGATPPVIKQFRVEEALGSHLTVIWWTDRPTIGRLEYGHTDPDELSTPWTEGLTTVNGATATGLELSTMYQFRIRVKDAAGKETVTEDVPIAIYQYTLIRPALEAHVRIRSSAFEPALLSVDRWTQVTWFNRDSVAHTVTGPGFASEPLAPGQTFSHTFYEAGTFNYACSIYPSMTGVIVVSTRPFPAPGGPGGTLF